MNQIVVQNETALKGSESFDYKASVAVSVTTADLTKEAAEIVVLSKHLSNFWKTLNTPLINCEIELISTWSKKCALISKTIRDGNYDANPILPKIDTPTSSTFQTTDTKLYAPVVTLSKENDKNF